MHVSKKCPFKKVLLALNPHLYPTVQKKWTLLTKKVDTSKNGQKKWTPPQPMRNTKGIKKSALFLTPFLNLKNGQSYTDGGKLKRIPQSVQEKSGHFFEILKKSSFQKSLHKGRFRKPRETAAGNPWWFPLGPDSAWGF